MCLIVSTVLKAGVLPYGGLKLHRQVMPFMFGLILGEYNEGRIINIKTYDFAPG